jgi:hypothetical protein
MVHFRCTSSQNVKGELGTFSGAARVCEELKKYIPGTDGGRGIWSVCAVGAVGMPWSTGKRVDPESKLDAAEGKHKERCNLAGETLITKL